MVQTFQRASNRIAGQALANVPMPTFGFHDHHDLQGKQALVNQADRGLQQAFSIACQHKNYMSGMGGFRALNGG